MYGLILAVASLTIFGACSKKDKESTELLDKKMLENNDALPVLSRLPTRPEGGLVPGKVAALDPEENARRKTRNEIINIEFGSSVAGINMKTTKQEARNILSAPLGASQGLEAYPEHIRIQWGDGEAPVPALIVVDDGYGGSLNLPAPYGKLSVGQALPSIKTEVDLKAFMRAAGASFEGKTGQAYDCELAFTCRFLSSNGSYELQFRKGGFIISTETGTKLQIVYFLPEQKFYPRVTGPIVYGSSIGDLTLNTSKTSFESKYGPPEQVSGPFSYYDQGSVRVAWGPSRLPLAMGALRTYEGSMDFGATIGSRKIGDSFASYAVASDDGRELMLALDRHFEARATVDFDCSTQTPTPLCSYENDGELLVIELTKGTFVFTAASDKRFLLYQVQAQ